MTPSIQKSDTALYPTPPPVDPSLLPVSPSYDALYKNEPSSCLGTHLKHFFICLRSTTYFHKVYDGTTNHDQKSVVESEEEGGWNGNMNSCQKYWRHYIRCTQARGGDEKAKEWLLKQEKGIVDLDEERKAAMVSNLLVVLCGDRNVQPVVNTGTLYN